MSDPRIVNVVVNHLSPELVRFVVATFDAVSWRSLSLDQRLRFGDILRWMHVDGASLAVIVASWYSLSPRERSDLVAQTHEFELARLRSEQRRSGRTRRSCGARATKRRRGLRLVIDNQTSQRSGDDRQHDESQAVNS